MPRLLGAACPCSLFFRRWEALSVVACRNSRAAKAPPASATLQGCQQQEQQCLVGRHSSGPEQHSTGGSYFY